MTVLSLLGGILLGSVFTACHKTADMSSFYFPVDQLENGMYYNYVSAGELPLPDDLWLYKSYQKDGEWFLVSRAFDHRGRETQKNVERMSDLGMLADTVRLFLKDSMSYKVIVDAALRHRAVFPFYRHPEDTIVYTIIWTDPEDQLEYTFSRRRIFVGDTTYVLDGRPVDAVRFDLVESLETFWSHDGMTNSEWTGMEIYARDIGLVYFIKRISPEFTREYRLERRYSPE